MAIESTVIPFVTSILLLRRLNKSPQINSDIPNWTDLYKKGLVATSALYALGLIFDIEYITAWLWHGAVLFGLVMVLKKKELQDGRIIAIAVLPYEIVALLSIAIQHLIPSLYKKIEGFTDTAQVFTIIWGFGIWIYASNQQKKIDKERLKRKQEEELYKITEIQKTELEITVAERTSELLKQKEELQKSLSELQATQAQLIHSEKMASLGELTAGIAHEIQNPLNFVNNFSEVSVELLDEMEEEMAKGNSEEVKSIADSVKQNLQKIIQHGKRADSIVKGMLQHSRKNTGQKELTDINALADEYLRLSYQGLRAKDKSFNASLRTDFDMALFSEKAGLGKINIIPQDIGRVLLNLFNNAFYAVNEKKKLQPTGYEPTVSVTTKRLGPTGGVKITIRDNGMGIPQRVIEKIFQPFFTTKPSGEGTGLGLSLSYDIITKAHNGKISVNTQENEFTEFVIELPG